MRLFSVDNEAQETKVFENDIVDSHFSFVAQHIAHGRTYACRVSHGDTPDLFQKTGDWVSSIWFTEEVQKISVAPLLAHTWEPLGLGHVVRYLPSGMCLGSRHQFPEPHVLMGSSNLVEFTLPICKESMQASCA